MNQEGEQGLGVLFGYENEWTLFTELAGFEPGALAKLVLSSMAGLAAGVMCRGERKAGWFFSHRGRAYVDQYDTRLETCTPEAADPLDAAAALKAGERLLVAAVDATSREIGGTVYVSRASIDPYSKSIVSQHENIMTPRPPAAYNAILLAYLATRQVWASSGGVSPDDSSPSFLVSPRLSVVTDASFRIKEGGPRQLMCMRDEPLSSTGSHRLHITAGEAVGSEVVSALKIGISALIARVADLGGEVDIQLLAPLKALHAVSCDVTCKAEFALKGKRGRWSAVQVQRHYLELVTLYVARLPGWAKHSLRLWEEILDAIEGSNGDLLLLSRHLEWPMKYAAFLEMKRRGLFTRLQMSEILDLRWGQLSVGIYDSMGSWPA